MVTWVLPAGRYQRGWASACAGAAATPSRTATTMSFLTNFPPTPIPCLQEKARAIAGGAKSGERTSGARYAASAARAVATQKGAGGTGPTGGYPIQAPAAFGAHPAAARRPSPTYFPPAARPGYAPPDAHGGPTRRSTPCSSGWSSKGAS